ncbi:MAG: hypothetical protein WCH75_10365, partial [Candidatus Binatia bacterium]
GGFSAKLRREVVKFKCFAFADNKSMLDHVSQFPNIAKPGIILHCFQGIWANRLNPPQSYLVELVDEMPREGLDIAGALGNEVA